MDVERLYGATPEQLRSAAESYEVESQRLLDAVVEGSGGMGGAGGKSAKKIEEMTARAFRYAGEGRRLRFKAGELEVNLGSDPNDPRRLK